MVWRMSHDPLPAAPPLSAVLEAALYAEDLDAAESFYGGVLGLERIVRVGVRHVFYRVGAAVLLVFNPAETPRPPSNPDLPVPPHGATGPGHLCLAATREQIDLWRARLEAAGHPIEADFLWPNGARSIYFRDPAGNSLEIAEPRLWFDDNERS
jgi:catechol 2,3-dioxygenase-like lactoylglutathione lyase family enzyme